MLWQMEPVKCIHSGRMAARVLSGGIAGYCDCMSILICPPLLEGSLIGHGEGYCQHELHVVICLKQLQSGPGSGDHRLLRTTGIIL